MTRLKCLARQGYDALARDPVGAYLVGMGSGYILIGVTWAVLPSHGRQMGVEWAPFLTPGIVALMWGLGGGLAIFTGLIATLHRRWGFIGLQATALFLTLIFAVSSILGFIPDAVIPAGRPESIITAVSYGTFWVSSWAASMMPAWRERDALPD